MYNRDVDVVICTYMYRYICMHTDARPSMPSHRYTHACKSTRTRMHDEMAADRRRCGRRCACVCASGHPYTPRCTSVDTDAHVQMGIPHPRAHTRAHMHTVTQTWILYMHSYIYICAHTYTYICTRLVVARVRAAPDARSHAHTHTHIRADMYSIYARKHMHMSSDIPPSICT